jgi:hypothetical protein
VDFFYLHFNKYMVGEVSPWPPASAAPNILKKKSPGAAVIRGHTPSLAPTPLWLAAIRVAVVTAVVIESLLTLEGRAIIRAWVNNAIISTITRGCITMSQLI